MISSSFWQKLSDAVTFATSFSVDAGKGAAPGATVASEYKYAADTTLKSKFAVTPSKDFRVGLAVTHNWNSAAAVTVGADLNALTLLGTNKGDAHSFGFEIKLK